LFLVIIFRGELLYSLSEYLHINHNIDLILFVKLRVLENFMLSLPHLLLDPISLIFLLFLHMLMKLVEICFKLYALQSQLNFV